MCDTNSMVYRPMIVMLRVERIRVAVIIAAPRVSLSPYVYRNKPAASHQFYHMSLVENDD